MEVCTVYVCAMCSYFLPLFILKILCKNKINYFLWSTLNPGHRSNFDSLFSPILLYPFPPNTYLHAQIDEHRNKEYKRKAFV